MNEKPRPACVSRRWEFFAIASVILFATLSAKPEAQIVDGIRRLGRVHLIIAISAVRHRPFTGQTSAWKSLTACASGTLCGASDGDAIGNIHHSQVL
jgi:hypothetical protein